MEGASHPSPLRERTSQWGSGSGIAWLLPHPRITSEPATPRSQSGNCAARLVAHATRVWCGARSPPALGVCYNPGQVQAVKSALFQVLAACDATACDATACAGLSDAARGCAWLTVLGPSSRAGG